MKTLFVVLGGPKNEPRVAYLRDFRPAGQIVIAPEIGDTVIDVLEVSEDGDKISVWSTARLEMLRLYSSWSWGDQYDPGAEYALAEECLGVWYHGRNTLLQLEYGPLFPLMYVPMDAAAKSA